jgi:sarcosine oxidase subunit beta
VVIGFRRPLSFKQTADGTVLIGGGWRAHVDRDAEATLLDWRELRAGVQTLHDLLPVIRGVVINHRGWAGIEARMPDDLLVLGRSAVVLGFFHQSGSRPMDFPSAPNVGCTTADLAVRGHTELPIAALSVQRFAAPAAGEPLQATRPDDTLETTS